MDAFATHKHSAVIHHGLVSFYSSHDETAE